MARFTRSQRGIAALAVAGGVAIVAVVAALFFLLPTRTVNGRVSDGLTGQPLSGVVIKVDGRDVQTGNDGSFRATGLRFGSPVDVAARGYIPMSAMVGLDDTLKFLLDPRILDGVVTDSVTGKPVSGAQLAADNLAAHTDDQGRFRLVGIEPGTSIAVSSGGYVRGGSLVYSGQQTASLSLDPTTLSLRVLNQYTGQPVRDVEVTDGKATTRSDAEGKATLRYLQDGAEVTLRLDGFTPARIAFSGHDSADVRLRPDTVIGTVRDSNSRPIANASVTDGRSTVATDAGGAFKLAGIQENAKLFVSAAGYERKQVEVGQAPTVDVALKPVAAKGTYLTYYGAGDEGLLGRLFSLAETTEINAVVIDVKGDRGWLAYRSDVPLVREIGAEQDIMIPDPKKLLADLKKRGVYTIARIVAFKDKPLASAHPEWSVINSATGKPWVDGEGLNWMDATREEVWDYNIALAVEAIQNGFDEVQFDYVRFPTDASEGNSLDSIRFSKPNTMATRMAAINGFLEKAARAIHAAGGAISADIFGYVVWHYGDDMGIGQILEEVAKRVDYVSPMVYPNLFWDGIEVDGVMKYGGQKSGLYPYEVVNESMKVAVRRVGAAKLRPWLEYYSDYITDKTYGDAEMKAQKRATYDAGVNTWLFWDPSNRYVKGGFEPK